MCGERILICFAVMIKGTNFENVDSPAKKTQHNNISKNSIKQANSSHWSVTHGIDILDQPVKRYGEQAK